MAELKEIIHETLSRAGIQHPPVEMEKILKVLDLEDLFFDSGIDQENGTVLFLDQLKGKWRIKIPSSLPRGRLIFDLAHECVEYLALKADIKCSHREINEGAVEMLIPEKWGKEFIEKEGLDLFAFKRAFSTPSLDTCAYRLLDLAPFPGVLVVLRDGERRVHRRRQRAWFSPDEEEFIQEASTSPNPIIRNLKGEVFQSFPIWDQRKFRVKKSYIYFWEGN
ncbi:MAG: hypothetical protein NUV68_03175 [Caldiserica bacterium]|jgi:hypothetical protein|nr:hypothetical protein [Caldisericota bacterium]MDH7562455.1 hypothetical protein [Caldisericota bacterium]